jgi:hypothetical protein
LPTRRRPRSFFIALALSNEWFTGWLGNDPSELMRRLPLTVLAPVGHDVDLSADPDERRGR